MSQPSGQPADLRGDSCLMQHRAGNAPLRCAEAAGGRRRSCLGLLGLMLTVPTGPNYSVLVCWACGWEQKRLCAEVGPLHQMQKPQNPKRAPPRSGAHTLRLRESASIGLSLWRESSSCTWHSSSSVMISNAASSSGLEASLVTVP